MKDFDIKKSILDNRLDKIYNKARALNFRHGINDGIEDFLDCYGYEYQRVCRNLNASSYKKWRKCLDKTTDMVLLGQGWFLTLTFKDEILNSTSAATRRRYVSRTLKQFSKIYIANVDYGDLRGREHYHGLVACEVDPQLFLKGWVEKIGFVKVKKVRPTDKDLKATSRYVAKLTNHALKDSTFREKETPRIVYSRNLV